MATKPLELYNICVPPKWLDYNGHMNDAYYVVVFSQATDRLIEHIGLDAAYREQEQRSVYTLKNHICYRHEARRGDGLRVTTQLLEYDAKRLRVFHALYRGVPQAAPFDAPVAARVRQLALGHVCLPVPQYAGRAIRRLAAE